MKNIERLLLAIILSSVALAACLIAIPAQASPLLIDCPRADVEVRFTNPKPGDTVSRVVQIEGSAKVPDSYGYRLDFSPTGREAWAPIGGEVRQIVVNGQLGVWDSGSVPDGAYTIRLRALDQARQYCDAFVNITVNNTRPTPTLIPTEEPTEPSAPAVPTTIPTVLLPGETPLPTRTPRPAATPGSSSPLPGGLNFDSILGSVSDLFQLLGRTCLFGVAAGAGIMSVVGVIFLVRRLI